MLYPGFEPGTSHTPDRRLTNRHAPWEVGAHSLLIELSNTSRSKPGGLRLLGKFSGDQTHLSARLPPRLTKFNPRPGHFRIFTCENRARRCRWSAGFLWDLPSSPPHFHSGATRFSPQSPSSVLMTSLRESVIAIWPRAANGERRSVHRGASKKRFGGERVWERLQWTRVQRKARYPTSGVRLSMGALGMFHNILDRKDWSTDSCRLLHGARGGLAARLLASHQGEPCSIPGRITPGFSHGGIVSDDATGLALRRCSILTSFHPFGSQDLVVKSHPNLSTQLQTASFILTTAD
ncbi:hypothetical protein PR048_022438 [Dryococelus australis]|uniref:Uncharacterized protein n=1 Tax=Dryococelus australis TaxID=614101 RepID=A0ABQ9H132_9NEOP|nr:hypothetical protein PR048_022438 [Dryococelus australis]